MGGSESYTAFAQRHRGAEADGFFPGVVTPLLANGGSFAPAIRAQLDGGREAVIGRYSYGRFTYNAVFTTVPESQPFVTRLVCERHGRVTSDTHYGFEVRNSRVWTESAKLNERFKLSVSPFQDDNWMRQLFAPTFVDWLGERSPGDFSFELAYGSLLCTVDEDNPGEGGLEALWDAAGTVADRIAEESRE